MSLKVFTAWSKLAEQEQGRFRNVPVSILYVIEWMTNSYLLTDLSVDSKQQQHCTKQQQHCTKQQQHCTKQQQHCTKQQQHCTKAAKMQLSWNTRV